MFLESKWLEPKWLRWFFFLIDVSWVGGLSPPTLFRLILLKDLEPPVSSLDREGASPPWKNPLEEA